MIIYFYLLIPLILQSSDSSSIRGRNYKNDLVPFTSSRLESSKKDNSLKILSNEPFIIQMQMPKGHENKLYKDTEKKKKRPMKKRVSKIKPLRKKLRRRRDLQKLKSVAAREKKSIQLETPQTANATKIELKNFTKISNTRAELLKALTSHTKKRESIKSKTEHFKDDNRNSTLRTNAPSHNFHKNHISLFGQSPTVKMVYPSTPKPDRHNHKYTYQDLITDRKRLEQKINYIKNMLDVNDTSMDDIIRIRRRSESDRTANKIAKMFLTLSAVNGLHDKRRSKCKDGYDEDDHVQDIWEKERKSSPSRKNSSSNEERYKVKKWIEFMKNKRSSGKTCTCLENHYGQEGDIFPLEQKLPRDYLLEKRSKSSEESLETPEDSFYSSNKLNKNNFKKLYRDDSEDQLKGLIKNYKKKSDLPLSELELYRSRAKEILRNAEEILDRIKEEEEKRLASPNFLMNHLKELTARVQGDPRNNENDLIKKIQKSLGWNPLAKSQDGQGWNNGNTFVDNMKSYILDPYEKAKALTDESTKKLSTYLLENLGKFQESSEEEQPRESDNKNNHYKFYSGSVPQKEEEKPQSYNLAREQPHSFSNNKELPNCENTLSTALSCRKEPIKSAVGNNQQNFYSQKMEDIMKEQQKKLNEFAITNDSKESSQEMRPVSEVKGLKEVKLDLPTAEDKVSAPKDEVSETNQQPRGEIETTNTSKIYNSGFAAQKPTPEESFQEEKDEKNSAPLQKEEKNLVIQEKIIEATEEQEQVNGNQQDSVTVEKEQSTKSQPTAEDTEDPTLRLEQRKEQKQEPQEIRELVKAEKTESLGGKENEMQEKKEEKRKMGEGILEKEDSVQEKHGMTDPSHKTDRDETNILTSPNFIPEDYNDFLELENGEVPEEKETFKEDLEDNLKEFSPNEESFLRMKEEPDTESNEEARAESDLLSELLDPSRPGEEVDNLKESVRADEQGKEDDTSGIQTQEQGQETLNNGNLGQDYVSESKEANEPSTKKSKNEDTLLESTKLGEEAEEKRNKSEKTSFEEHTTYAAETPTEGRSTGENSNNETVMKEADSNERAAKSSPKEQGIYEAASKETSLEEKEEKAVISKDGIDVPTLRAMMSEENDQNSELEGSSEEVVNGALENKAEVKTQVKDEESLVETGDPNENFKVQNASVGDETSKTAANNKNEKSVDSENETVKAAAADEDQETDDAKDETVKAADENQETDDAKDENVKAAAAADEDQETDDAEDETVKAAAADEDQETDDAKDETVKTAAADEDQETDDAEDETVKAADENQETDDPEDDEAVKAAAADEDQETDDAKDETVKAADENQGTDDAKNENVKAAAAADEDPETDDAENDENVKAADEDQETDEAENDETVKAADENQETDDPEDDEAVKAAAADEDQETDDAENDENVKAAAADEDQETDEAENDENVKAAAAADEDPETDDADNDENVKAADEDQETDEAENDETVKAADENQETDDAEDETVKAADFEESDGQGNKNDEKPQLRATLDDRKNEKINEDEDSLKEVNSNEKVELKDLNSEETTFGTISDQVQRQSDILVDEKEVKQNIDNESVEASLNDSKNIEETDFNSGRSKNFNEDQEMGDKNLLKSENPENEFGNTVDDETPLKSAKIMNEADEEMRKEESEGTPKVEDNLDSQADGKSVNNDETLNSDESLKTEKAETPLGDNLIMEDSEDKINQDSSLSDLLRVSNPGRKLKVPKSIGEIMKDLEEGKEKDDITSIENLNPDKIDHIIDKIDEAEQQNLLGSPEVDCRKECACADEIDTRSRNMGRYEIVKDFLHWMKDLQLNRVL